MKRTGKLGWRKLIAISAALACAGSWAAGEVRSVRDRAEVMKMLEKNKTLCIGRILVEPGFCIQRAVFAESLFRRKNEHITLHLGLKGHPDFGLALSSMPGGGNGDTLLERIARTDSDSSIDEMMHVTKLRSGKRTVNGFDGEEEVERAWELNLTTGFSFMSSIRSRKVSVPSTSSEINPVAHFNPPCLPFNNAKRLPDGILFDIPRLDYRTVPRQSALCSVPDSLATLVSTLP